MWDILEAYRETFRKFRGKSCKSGRQYQLESTWEKQLLLTRSQEEKWGEEVKKI